MRGGITFRKFISFVLCAALLVTGTGAAGVYEVDGDTSSSFLVRSSAYDVLTTDLTTSDLASYLGVSSPLYKLIQLFDSNVEDYLGAGSVSPSSYSISWWLSRIIYRFGLPQTGVNSTFFGWLPNVFTDFAKNELGLDRADPGLYTLGYYLKNSMSGLDEVVSAVDDTTSAVDSNTDAVNDHRISNEDDFDTLTAAVDSNTDAVNDHRISNEDDFDTLTAAVDSNTDAVNDHRLSNEADFDSFESLFSSLINGSDGPFVFPTGTDFVYKNGNVIASEVPLKVKGILNNGFQSLRVFLNTDVGPFVMPTGTNFLYSTGYSTAATIPLKVDGILTNGFLGLSQILNSNMGPFLLASGSPYLNASGQSVTSDSMLPIDYILDRGFLGVRSLIAGSSSSNVYNGSLVDNQHQYSTYSSVGIGPMLNQLLSEVQNDTGLLTYIFASPEDIEIKQNSASNMSSVNDTFINPDSSTSVSSSDIGALGSAAGSIEGLGQTGVTPDQAFTQLSNDSIFEFFTSTTAGNLDTTVSTFARGDLSDDPSKMIVTDYYEQSRNEFFELIGEG